MAVIDLAPGVTYGMAAPAALAPIEAALALHLGAPAATVVHGLPGAVLVAVAACLAGERLAHVDRLPEDGGRIVLQQAHAIRFGCRLEQILALAGAVPVPIGSADVAALYQLEGALADGAVGALFVVRPDRAGQTLVDLPSFLFAAHARRLPVVVVAPEANDWTGLLDAGADLVVLDAAAALGGPSAGIIAGRAELVRAARLQRLGVGGLVQPTPALLDEVAASLRADRRASLEARRDRVAARLAAVPGLAVEAAGQGLCVLVDAVVAGFTARDLAFALGRGEPAVLLDDREAVAGRLRLDLARPDEAALEQAVVRLGACLEAGIEPAPWPWHPLDATAAER